MSLSFVIKEGFSSMGRAKIPAVITVIISFFALVMLGLFSTVSLSFFDVIQELRSRVELEVFLGDSMSDSQAIDTVGQIKMLKGVKEASYVSKEDAAQMFKHDFGDIRYNQSFLGQIEKNARLFTLLTGGLGVLISLATIVLIGYTIRLAMYSRKEKIRTMRLVGATGWFIGAPYVIEGALQGLLSGAFAAGAVYLLFDQLLFRYEPGIYKALHSSVVLIYPATVLLGLILGILGSALSVSKYLRIVSKR